jgi:hypothetical protein
MVGPKLITGALTRRYRVTRIGNLAQSWSTCLAHTRSNPCTAKKKEGKKNEEETKI